MTRSVDAEAGRRVARAAAVSAVGHLVILALGVAAARDLSGDTIARAFWLLALFAGLGLVATGLAWASLELGRAAWNAGIALMVVSLLVLAYTATIDGAAPMLVLGGALLFTDWLVFASAHRAID